MTNLQQRIHRTAQELIAAGTIPNAAVLIDRGGQPLVRDFQGRRDLAQSGNISPDSLFRLFSISKLLTSAAIMTLVDAGRLTLDDAVMQFIPAFAQLRVRTESGLVDADRAITVHHLLTHTSGIGYMPVPSIITADYETAQLFAFLNRSTETLVEHVERLAELPLAHQPGTAWNYGENMGVLGRIIEVVTGGRLSDYLHETLFHPLDMPDTGFHVPTEKAHRLTALYAVDASGQLQDVANQPFYGGDLCQPAKLEYGGGGLIGTGRDLMNFGAMLLGQGLFRGQRILSADSVHQMMTNQLDWRHGAAPLAAFGRGADIGFGLGGSVTLTVGRDTPAGNVGEYGWGGWAGLNFWIDPADDLIAITMTQAIPPELGPYPLGTAVRNILYPR